MVVFTDHAQDRVETRLIRRAWVEEVIASPDQVIPAKYGRTQAIKKFKGQEISVVYAKEGNEIVVITVFWGR